MSLAQPDLFGQGAPPQPVANLYDNPYMYPPSYGNLHYNAGSSEVRNQARDLQANNQVTQPQPSTSTSTPDEAPAVRNSERNCLKAVKKRSSTKNNKKKVVWFFPILDLKFDQNLVSKSQKRKQSQQIQIVELLFFYSTACCFGGKIKKKANRKIKFLF